MKKTLLLILTFSIIFLLSMSSFVVAESPSLEEISDRYDLGGETVKILTVHEGIYSDFLDGEGLAWKKEVEKMFNCNIEFDHKHWSEIVPYTQKKVMAGEQPADIMWWQFRFIHRDGGAYDFIQPLNDVIEDEYYDRLPDMALTGPENYKIAGVQYGVPMPTLAVSLMTWNKTMFKENGITSLYKIVENGEWTWDKLLEIGKKLTKDTNGDGEIDQWGMAPWYFDQTMTEHYFNPWVEHQFTWAWRNDAPPFKLKDGRLVFAGTEPNFIEALEYFADPATNQPEGYHVNYPEDRFVAFANGNVGITDGFLRHGDPAAMEDDWGMVPWPKGPSADDYVSTTSMWTGIFLPIGVENPRAKIEVFTALYETAEPYIDDKEEYVEELWNDWAMDFDVRDRETIKWAKWSLKNAKTVSASSVLKGRFPGSLTEEGSLMFNFIKAARGEVSAASQMEAIKPKIQAALDDMFNN